MIYLLPMVISVTVLMIMSVAAGLTARPAESEPADPDKPTPGELPRAGRLDDGYVPGPPFAADHRYYGPFPVDTGPLLILSEETAALVALERDIRAMIAEAERKIGPVE